MSFNLRLSLEYSLSLKPSSRATETDKSSTLKLAVPRESVQFPRSHGHETTPTKPIFISSKHSTIQLDSKANDQESLRLLLEASKQRPIATTNSVVKPEEAFVIRQSMVEEDSGSDLVSSVQRARIGGLGSYFLEVGEREGLGLWYSRGESVSEMYEAEEDQCMYVHSTDEDGWEEVVVGERGDEDLELQSV
jgi:hypothetical protein